MNLAANISIFITSIIVVAFSSFNSETKKVSLEIPLKSEKIKPFPKEQIEIYNLKLKCVRLEESSKEILNTIKRDLK